MPCYTQRLVTLDLTVADEDVLLRGLKAAGFRVTQDGGSIYAYTTQGVQVRIAGGKATTAQGQEEIVNEVKRAYAAEAVRTAARRYGFNVAKDARDARHVTLNRRSF